MPVKQNIPYQDGIYFITITCYRWLPLIEQTSGYDAVYKWFDYLKKEGHYITGYVIMPNHLHALIGFKNKGKSINRIVGDGKRFIAYEVVKRLKAQHSIELLTQLQNAVEEKDRQRKKLHEVWADSFDWKECRSDAFITQKLAYMHLNPCAGKWDLAFHPGAYPHSSAAFYNGDKSLYELTHFKELKDVNLTHSD